VVEPPYATAKLLDAAQGQPLQKLVQNIIDKKLSKQSSKNRS